MAHTVTQLILLARQSADMEGDPLCEDPEITEYLTDARGKFYREYCKANTDAYLKSTTFTLVNGQNTQALPVDFYASRGLGIVRNGREYPLDSFVFQNRGRGGLAFRVDSLIRLSPPQGNLAGSYVFWYNPDPLLAATLDEIEDNYYTFFVDYAAWRMLTKAKLDSSEQKTGMSMVISAMKEDAQNRDSNPAQAPDAADDSMDVLLGEFGY